MGKLRRPFLAAIIAVVVVVAALGLLLLRNYELDSGIRAYKEGNDASAANKFMLLAKLGEPKAQYILGIMYAFGQGVPKNDSKAIYWFRRAGILAEKGIDRAAPAEFGVAKSYAYGTDGVKVDKAQSLKWLRLAAEGGCREAMRMLSEVKGPTPARKGNNELVAIVITLALTPCFLLAPIKRSLSRKQTSPTTFLAKAAPPARTSVFLFYQPRVFRLPLPHLRRFGVCTAAPGTHRDQGARGFP